MSGVVLRCPHCGTVKASPGECEACSEAQVRYYCTNHSPGRWLDGTGCPQCGARFGDPAPKPAPPRPAPPRPAPERRAPAPPPRTAPPPPVFAPPPTRGPSLRSPWGRGRSRPSVDDERPIAPEPRRPSLPELLRAARRGRAPATYAPSPPPAGSLIGAFIRRLLFLVLFFVGALLLLGVLGGGPLLEILLTLLLNSGNF